MGYLEKWFRLWYINNMSSNKFIQVVLPSANELAGRTILASDFAVACGARFREFFYSEKQDVLKLRNEWKPDEANLNCAYAATSTVVCQKKRDGGYDFLIKGKFPSNNRNLEYVDDANLNCFAGDHALLFSLKFVHPETAGMTVEPDPRYHGVEMGVMKIGDQIPTVPQSYAGSQLSKKLESLMKRGQLQQTGTFTVDGVATPSADSATTRNGSLDEAIDPVVCPRFTYQGVDYVRKNFACAKTVRRPDCCGDYKLTNGQFMDGTTAKLGKPYWFKCEPCHVVRTRDGSILCYGIFPCQLEPQAQFEKLALDSIKANERLQLKLDTEGIAETNVHTEELSGGKFLNQVFLKELYQSVGKDLDQMRVADKVR